MFDNATNEVKGSFAQLTTGMHHVLAILIDERDVHVEAATAFVIPWLTHKGGIDAGARSNVFHCVLHEEGAVSGIHSFAMPEIDFVL